ncbi:ATP-grasp domain-containing protein [Desulfosoma sp.]
MVVSYHPVIPGDVNRLCAGREPDEQDRDWFRKARAVILPQGCSESLYRMAVRHCPRVFPNYRARFLYPGKIGDIRLFRALGFPHPQTSLFLSTAHCPESFLASLSYPAVFKGNHGGEGEQVFPVFSFQEARSCLRHFAQMERCGFPGFLVQQFIPTDGRDLRVVVIGHTIVSYWRVQDDPSHFWHNTSRGARIDPHRDPDLQAVGRRWVRHLCAKTGINLAGFDLLFPCQKGRAPAQLPLFLEINYFFGRKGLGGSMSYYALLQDAVSRWLAGH